MYRRILAAFLGLVLVVACGVPASDVSTTLTDATKCAFGIIATAGGSIDVNGLLACGLTVADALKLLQDLRTNATTSPADAAPAAMTPERVAYVGKLDKAIADLKGRQ